MLSLAATVATNIGLIRQVNEDRIVVGPWILVPDGASSEAPENLEGVNVVAVLDGMGGHVGGELAATTAAEVLARLGRTMDSAAAAESAVRQANEAVYRRMAEVPQFVGMGTTVAGLALASEDVVLFNVGDARIYVETDGYLLQASTDDSVASGALTQSLGGRPAFEAVRPHVVVEPAVDRRFLLATDGLFGHLEHEQIEACMLGSSSSDAAAALLGLALDRGGPDNVSVALVEARRPDEREAWSGE